MDNEKNLPINVALREQDIGNTVGNGGGEDKTKWLLSGEKLNRRKEQLISDIDKINSEWDKTLFDGLPHALKVTFINEALANTHQSKIIPMFDDDKKNNQIGFIGVNSLIIKVNTKKNLERIRNNFLDTLKNLHAISAITKIKLFEPQVKLVNYDNEYKLIPLDYNDSKLNEKALEIIKKHLNEHNIKNELILFGSNIKIFKISSITMESLKFIRTLPIRSIEPIAKVDVSSLNINKSLVSKFKLQSFDPKLDYPVIGLLDTGVANNKLTKNWVIRGKGCHYSSNDLDTSHGTYIATLLIHGNTFNKINDYSINGCKIVDVPVVPNFNITECELINNIEDAVKDNSKVRIWNLSMGIEVEISDNEFSPFAIELDHIQKKYNVIICKSAGNDKDFFSKKQVGKISIGAESIRSLTVGSMNRNTDKYNYTIKNLPAKYSRRGLGPASIVKPDLTHFGGDLFAKTSKPSKSTEFEQVSDTASIDGIKLIHSVGTSFSTPKITKNIAELDLFTNHKYDLLTLKALEVHSAKYIGNPPLSVQKRLEYLGYGKPTNAGDTIFKPSFASTLILRGVLKKGRNIDIMDFPYPTALIKNGYYTGRIKITLAYDPILFSNQGVQYCQSNLEIKFGTYDHKKNNSGRLLKFNPISREDSINILLNREFGKRIMKKNTEYADERTLIKYGQKYHPIKKYVFDLAELRNSFKKYLLSNKHWYLFLEGHYRYYAINCLDKKDLFIPYSLIITIEDPKQEAQVYNSTVASLQSNNFIHNNILINNHINLIN